MIFNNGNFIKVEFTKCLNNLHHGVGCNHCISGCPADALHFFNEKIILDKESCIGCGLCLTDCPTEVFTAIPWDEQSIFDEVNRQGKKTTQFFCDYHDSPYLLKNEKEKGAIQIPGCLGSVSKGAWYEIGLKTTVEIRLDKCTTCPMNKCIDRLKINVETAMEWLAASGHHHDFSFIYQAKEAIKRKKFMAVSTGMKTTSRRDLFLALFNQGKEVIHRVRETNHTNQNRKKHIRKKSYLSTWQKRLKTAYVDNFQEGGTPAYWPAVIKKKSCVNCGICSSNCPTKALKIMNVDGVTVHTFNSGECIDCRICMLFCPTDSIERFRQENLKPFNEKLLTRRKTVSCKHCGEMTVEDKDVCYWCENEADDSQVIFDVWKHLIG